jgi:hypothetical protein
MLNATTPLWTVVAARRGISPVAWSACQLLAARKRCH